MRFRRAICAPHRGVRQPELGIVAIGGDAIVAGKREFECAAETGAVDRAGDRLAGSFECTQDARNPGGLGEQLPFRRVVTVALSGLAVAIGEADRSQPVGHSPEALREERDLLEALVPGGVREIGYAVQVLNVDFGRGHYRRGRN